MVLITSGLVLLAYWIDCERFGAIWQLLLWFCLIFWSRGAPHPPMKRQEVVGENQDLDRFSALTASKLLRFGSYFQVSYYPCALSIPSVSALSDNFKYCFDRFRDRGGAQSPPMKRQKVESENEDLDRFSALTASKLLRFGSYFQVS